MASWTSLGRERREQRALLRVEVDLAVLPRAGAVDAGRARVNGGGESGVADFHAFEQGITAAAEAEHVVRRGQAFDLVIGPFGQQSSRISGDLQAGGGKRHHRVIARAGLAVEINPGA